MALKSRVSGILAMYLILLVVFLGLASLAHAGKRFYVSLHGDDGNSGSAEKPWRTVQYAANAARAGDTVVIRAGTYNEDVSLAHSGQAEAPVTFTADPQGKVTVKSFILKRGVSHVRLMNFIITGYKYWGIEITGGNHYISLSKLKIKGGEAGLHITEGDSGQSPRHGPVSHITLEDSVIQDTVYAGVDGTPGPCNYLVFRRVEVSGSGLGGEDSYASDGISIERGHHINVEGCYIHDNGGDGIDLNSRDRGGRVPGIVVSKNVVARNHFNGVKLWSGGRLEGNAIWGQGDNPLVVGIFPGRAEIIYNTVAYNMWARDFGSRNYAATFGYPEPESGGPPRPKIELILHHNIFAFNTGPAQGEPTGIYLGPGVRLMEEHHNLFFSRPDNEIIALFLGGEREFSRADISRGVWAKATGQGQGDLTVNPRFVSGWPQVNLHLKPDSPAAGRGAYAATTVASRRSPTGPPAN